MLLTSTAFLQALAISLFTFKIISSEKLIINIMKIRKATKKQSKIKMSLQGPAGSGKSFSSILLAKGLVSDLSKVVVIDTESGSADLYSHLGDYQVLRLVPPYSPERYIEAIESCEKFGAEVIIIDSISHCWEELLFYHSQLPGNSFSNWGKVTPRQNQFLRKILSSSAHVIATLRVKQDYVLSEKTNGKVQVEKLGLKSIQRDGVDYEFTVSFELDMQNNAKAIKDRTGLFANQPAFKISSETGRTIANWCTSGLSANDISEMISNSKNEAELVEIYKSYPDFYHVLQDEFINRKE